MVGSFASMLFLSISDSDSEMFQYLLRRWRWVALGLLLGIVATWLVSSYFAARYFVSRRNQPYVEKLPADNAFQFTEHRLISRDGETIGSWFAPGKTGSPMVVLVHGHLGDRSQCLPYAQLFQEMGCGTLLITMRAHGDSTGTLNDFGYGARLDVIAAVEFLQKHAPGRPILLLGISAGATAVSFAAAELGTQVAGVVMEEPFLDIQTAVKRRTDLYLPAGFSYLAHRGLVSMASLVIPHYAAIAPVEAVSQIPAEVPIWILAGGLDDRAYPEEAQAIYQRASTHAELTIFPLAHHESLLVHDEAMYRAQVKRWLTRLQALPR